jgi:hypothetical protein
MSKDLVLNMFHVNCKIIPCQPNQHNFPQRMDGVFLLYYYKLKFKILNLLTQGPGDATDSVGMCN